MVRRYLGEDNQGNIIKEIQLTNGSEEEHQLLVSQVNTTKIKQGIF